VLSCVNLICRFVKFNDIQCTHQQLNVTALFSEVSASYLLTKIMLDIYNKKKSLDELSFGLQRFVCVKENFNIQRDADCIQSYGHKIRGRPIKIEQSRFYFWY
jgi:hypothetical protein